MNNRYGRKKTTVVKSADASEKEMKSTLVFFISFRSIDGITAPSLFPICPLRSDRTNLAVSHVCGLRGRFTRPGFCP